MKYKKTIFSGVLIICLLIAGCYSQNHKVYLLELKKHEESLIKNKENGNAEKKIEQSKLENSNAILPELKKVVFPNNNKISNETNFGRIDNLKIEAGLNKSDEISKGIKEEFELIKLENNNMIKEALKKYSESEENYNEQLDKKNDTFQSKINFILTLMGIVMAIIGVIIPIALVIISFSWIKVKKDMDLVEKRQKKAKKEQKYQKLETKRILKEMEEKRIELEIKTDINKIQITEGNSEKVYFLYELLKKLGRIGSQISKDQLKKYKGEVFFYLSRYIDANDSKIEYLKEAINESPYNPNYHYNLGMIYKDIKEYRLSLEKFKDTNKIDPKLSIVYYGLGSAYLGLEKYKEAISNFEISIERKSNVAESYLGMGICYDRMSDDKALECYEKALEINDELAEAYNNRGNFKFKKACTKPSITNEYKKNIKEAIMDFEHAIFINKYFELAYFNLVKIYMNERNDKDFFEQINKLIMINPENSEYYFVRGRGYERENEYFKALDDYNRAIELNNEYIDAYHCRAILYLRNERVDDAQKECEILIQRMKDYNKKYDVYMLLIHIYEEKEKKEGNNSYSKEILELYKKCYEINNYDQSLQKKIEELEEKINNKSK